MMIYMRSNEPIFYFGVNGIGLGHARRSSRIIEELSGIANIVCTTYSKTSASSYLRRKGINVIEIPKLSWAETYDGGINYPKTLIKVPSGISLAAFHLLKDYFLIKKLKPRIVVSDMRAAPIIVAKKLGIPRFLIGLFFDFSRDTENKFYRAGTKMLGIFLRRLAKWSNKVFFTDFPPPNTIYERLLPEREIENMIYTGPIVEKSIEEKIRKQDILEIKKEAKQKLGLEEKNVVLFLSSGIEQAKRYFLYSIRKIMSDLQEIQDTKVIVSIGRPDKPASKKVFKNIELWTWIPDLTDYLFASDTIVGHVGLNKVFDSIAAGAYFIGLIMENQIEHIAVAKKLEELGIGVGIRKIDKKLVNILKRVLDERHSRKKVYEKSREISKYRPVEAIKKIIANYL